MVVAALDFQLQLAADLTDQDLADRGLVVEEVHLTLALNQDHACGQLGAGPVGVAHLAEALNQAVSDGVQETETVESSGG